MGLALVRWQGEYRGVTTVWIRWATLDGMLLPTPRELAEEAQQKAERLAAKLRELGINPESL